MSPGKIRMLVLHLRLFIKQASVRSVVKCIRFVYSWSFAKPETYCYVVSEMTDWIMKLASTIYLWNSYVNKKGVSSFVVDIKIIRLEGLYFYWTLCPFRIELNKK